MIRLAFHSNQLGLRGTEIALYDYAHYNEALLLNESIIVVPRAGKHDPRAVQRFESRFPLFYYDTADQRDAVIAREECAALYCIKSGANDRVVSRVAKTLVHCVFDMSEPHGDVYAGVSEFLTREFGGRFPFVPHIVGLPDIRSDLRASLGIPEDAVVFGRHGGFETFDLAWARAVVDSVAAERPDIFFVFLHTQRFCDRKNVLFLDATADVAEKVRFINTCDAMLHARADGETFGLACAEFSIRNKPVITCATGHSTCHLEILAERAILYRDAESLQRILTAFRPQPDGDWDAYTNRFNPLTVMKTFERVFLTPLGLGASSFMPQTAHVEHRGWKYSVLRNDALSRNVLRGVDWEPHVTACMTRLLRPGDYMIDVGASFGFHTLTAARAVTPTGRVLSFEPQSPIFRLLYQNCVDNGAFNVKLYHLAVADQRGEATLNAIDYEGDDVNLGDAFIASQDSRGEHVMAVPLDDIPLDQPVRLIKIDVQGAERFVLEGGARLIKADRPFLIVEFEEDCLHRYGYGSADLFDLIRSLDYSIFFLDYRYPSDHLCVPNERLAAFRDEFAGTIHPHTTTNVVNANLEHGITEKVVLV
jgi:FkbM family methyltransferase